MATPMILSKNGVTIYPATIPQAIIDPETGLPIDFNEGKFTDQIKSDVINSTISAVPVVTSVASAGIASSITEEVKNDILVSASNNTTAGYTGPFSVSISEGFVHINSGILYLGGIESIVATTSIASADGNVYFYMYHDGSYHSGFEIASSASALTSAAAITGSAGYYTAIATISNNLVTQYQYGNISIDGRIY